jgi:hypothetical protein
MKDQVSRTALNVWGVFGNVGGNQQVIIFVVAFLMSYISQISFTIEATCAMFEIQSKDKSLHWEVKELQISLYDKLKLILNIFPNEKFKRLLTIG